MSICESKKVLRRPFSTASPYGGRPVALRPATGERPRRLAIVSTNGPAGGGGLSAVVRSIGREFAKAAEVQVVSRFAEDGPAQVSYSAHERARRLTSAGLPVHVIAPRRASLPLLESTRWLSHHVQLQPAAVRLFCRSFGDPVERAIPADAEVVHYVGAGWEMLGFPALAAARRRGALFSVLPAIHPGVWGDSELDARLYRAADIVFVLSEAEQARLAELGVDPRRVVRSPCGPASDLMGDGQRFRRKHGLGNRPLVLFIGRKQRYKGYHALCSAMRWLLELVPDCCLVVVGKDVEPPYPHVRPDSLLDLGACGEQEKADALDACDVFCMPSSAEAFGIAYVEAWAAAKPVVAGPAPAVRELVRSGIDGYCVEQTPTEIATTLASLLDDRGLRARLGRAGLKRQRVEFTWARAAERALGAYEVGRGVTIPS